MIYNVALPFTPEEGGGLAPGQPVECPSGAAAIRRAEAIARHDANAGAVAFSRSGEPDVGEFQDAVILKIFGDVAGTGTCCTAVALTESSEVHP
jgi:hypothetical protein